MNRRGRGNGRAALEKKRRREQRRSVGYKHDTVRRDLEERLVREAIPVLDAPCICRVGWINAGCKRCGVKSTAGQYFEELNDQQKDPGS